MDLMSNGIQHDEFDLREGQIPLHAATWQLDAKEGDYINLSLIHI